MSELEQTLEGISQIAAEWRASGDGQGPYYNLAKRSVLWVGGDSDFQPELGYSEWEPMEHALLALPGVSEVLLKAEISPEDDEEGEWEGYTAVPYQPSLAVRQWEWDCICETYGEKIALEVCGFRPVS